MTLNADLELDVKWFKSNRMVINVGKRNSLLLCNKQRWSWLLKTNLDIMKHNGTSWGLMPLPRFSLYTYVVGFLPAFLY